MVSLHRKACSQLDQCPFRTCSPPSQPGESQHLSTQPPISSTTLRPTDSGHVWCGAHGMDLHSDDISARHRDKIKDSATWIPQSRRKPHFSSLSSLMAEAMSTSRPGRAITKVQTQADNHYLKTTKSTRVQIQEAMEISVQPESTWTVPLPLAGP